MVMKIRFLLEGIAALMALGAGITASGQLAYTTLELPRANPFSSPETISTPTYHNEVNPRAMRHFLTNFPEVSEEKWYFTSRLTLSTFTLNGIKYRVDYDRRGNWIETLRTYDETKLPADLCRAVAESYPCYKTTLVQDIEQPPHPIVYIVHLEGKTKLIKLQICNGVFYEWQKFDKSE